MNASLGRVLMAILFALSLPTGAAQAAKPDIDPSYANGQLVYMIGPHLIQDARDTQPNLYAHSEELHLLVYPINPSGTATDAKKLAGGYQPNCNPCYHPGLPGIFAYHDHVLTGAPGFGKAGTAGAYKGPWKIILLMYSPAVIANPKFAPIKDAKDIDAAEADGMFLPINDGPNPYEVDTGNVLICPLVSPHA
jgi:hypothetical protein